MQATPSFLRVAALTKTWVRCCTVNNAFTFALSRYYRHISQVQTYSASPTSSRSGHDFPTILSFVGYCDQMRWHNGTADGWMRPVISLKGCPVSRSRWFRCLLQLLRSLFHPEGVPCKIIPFREDMDSSWDRVYRNSWCGRLYEVYNEDVRNGHIILLDFYSDDAMLSKYGTQITKFVRVRL